MSTVREPVLLLAFNRPDRLRRVIDALRPQAPGRVYVAVDGPRPGVESDAARVAATQAIVGEIDWACEISTLFREQNLGCGRAVSSGITWFFEHEDSGVILEDDLIPGPDFLAYCDALLEQYRHDERVFAVSGCNLVPPDRITAPGSYRFSGITHIWGWATWKRAWQHYAFDLTGWQRRLPRNACSAPSEAGPPSPPSGPPPSSWCAGAGSTPGTISSSSPPWSMVR